MDYVDSSAGLSINVAERRRLVWKLRKAGYEYPEIADEVTELMGAENLPASWGQWMAHQDIQFILDRMRNEVAESTQDIIQIENSRLDSMLAALWPKAMAGNVGAVNAALKIMERRSRMFGLDEAVKVDWKVEVGGLIGAGLITREEARIELGDELYNLVARHLAENAEGDIGQEDMLATKLRTSTAGRQKAESRQITIDGVLAEANDGVLAEDKGSANESN